MDRPESAQTLGSFLRGERERRGVTIEQVASATKIAIKYLHALEADEFSELPAKPFVRGFVQSYARFVGLDPKDTLRKFEKFINDKSGERPDRDEGHKGYAFEPRDGEQRTRMILSVTLGVMVVVGGVAVALRPNLRSRKHGHVEKLRAQPSALPAAEVVAAVPSAVPSEASEAKVQPKQTPTSTEAQAVAETPAVATTPEVVASPAPGASPDPIADPLDSGKNLKFAEVKERLQIQALADIWVRYKVDDKPVRKFIMRKGSKLILKGKEKIAFQISNPKSATMSYNGTPTRRVVEAASLTQYRENSTLLYPRKVFDINSEIFGEQGALPMTQDPAEEAPVPQPTETPKLSTDQPQVINTN